jgi:single-stranded-DNA-specific exonuclease
MARVSTREIRRRVAMDGDGLPASLHPLLRRVYAARGVSSETDLLLALEQMIPVGQLGGVDQAVTLLCRHRASGGRIVVIGDFDADGATSTALVVLQLRRLGFPNVGFIVPNRFEYGYGLSPEIVALAAREQPALILTVDNGISSHAGVAAARALGIETLVTDHHLPAATLPCADAIVNPNANGDAFPSRALAGVGVAFYLLAALTRELARRGVCVEPPSVAHLLDLVALGTVADLVPLDRNNRILVHQGLKRIRAGRCLPGVRALIEASGRAIDQVVASDLGFQVGPRLNAAGRLDDMSVGIQCLLADDAGTARLMAARLEQLNRDRREIEARMQGEALDSIDAMLHTDTPEYASLPLGLCLFDESWHQGVVGLVASRIKDRVHRPVIAMARGDAELLKGSARSVPNVHIRDVLAAIDAHAPGLIEKFGGHAMAAGLTLRADRLEEFRLAFDAEVRRWLTAEQAIGVIDTDGELASEDLTIMTATLLREAGPWGQAFPEPTFDGTFVVRGVNVVGEKHLRLSLQSSDGRLCEAIRFRHFELEDAPVVKNEARVELAYRLDVNQYQGLQRLQLIVEHLRVLGEAEG